MCNNDDFSSFREEEIYDSSQHYPLLFLFQQQTRAQLIDERIVHNLEKQISSELSNSHILTEKYNYLSQSRAQIYQILHDQGEEEHLYFQEQKIEKQKKKPKLVVETMIPGESKNLSKCYARYLQQFINEVCESTENPELKQLRQDQDIQNFLSTKPEKITNFDLSKFIESLKGSIFAKEFFGNCLWKYGVVKESKTNVTVLYRHNIEQYSKVIKTKKIKQ